MPTETDFLDCLNALAKAIDLDNTNKYEEIVRAVTDIYKPGKLDPEGFHALICYKIDNFKEQLLYTYFPESKDNQEFYQALLIWQDIYEIVAKIVTKQHGTSAGSFDCSRWIADHYLAFVRNNTLIPDMTIDDHCYWKPKFGTGEEWMRLCRGIGELRRGQTLTYANAIMDLMHY